MKFSIRDLLLLTVIVAASLGWLVGHWRAAGREAVWENSFQSALQHFSTSAREEVSFDTPSGIWRVNCVTGVELPEDGR